MSIYFIKFLHLIFVLGLLGGTLYCIATPGIMSIKKNRAILTCVTLLALITGTLLVYPKHYTFHTPWIQVAYLMVTVFLILLQITAWVSQENMRRYRWIWRGFYLLLLILLVFTVHDAVTKTTFL